MRRFVSPLLMLLAACAPAPDVVPPTPPALVADCLANPACTRKLVAAHSANIWFAPPNSPAAYDASLAQHADLLETDIRISADGVPVLLHDDELEKAFTDCTGLISATAWADIAQCTFGVDTTGELGYDPKTLPPQHPLDLVSLVRRADGRAVVVAEIKKDDRAESLQAVLKAGFLDRVLFLGSADEVEHLRAVSKEAWIFLRTDDAAEVDAAIAANDPRIVMFHADRDWTDAAVIGRIHASGRKVWINTFSFALDALREFGGEELCTGWWQKGFDVVQTNRADLCVPAAAAFSAPGP